jgi:hypothetical protein
MKKHFIFVSLFLLMTGHYLSAANSMQADSSGGNIAREIDIRETVSVTTVLRSSPAPAVSAWLTDSQIDLTFLRNLGAVTITVTNAQETVYTATATVAEGSVVVISIQGWSPGDYAISIVRSNGQSFTGTFDL